MKNVDSLNGTNPPTVKSIQSLLEISHWEGYAFLECPLGYSVGIEGECEGDRPHTTYL